MTDDIWELYNLDPATLDEDFIQLGARKMIELFPVGASVAAAERADKALELGDLDNFNLWQRIAKAIEELEGTKHGASDAIN